MKAVVALVAVLLLALVAYYGAQLSGAPYVFGIALPYAALLLFLGGMVYRVMDWARSPVPFRIPTTCGQQKSLPWIQSSRFENPSDTFGVVGRMALEILLFRSLFRNTSAKLHDGPRLSYGSTKWLWAAGLAFHYAFLVVLLRHLRFFVEPVPGAVNLLAALDGFMQVSVPTVYITTALLGAAVSYLLLRRLAIPQVRYISLLADYFPLFLILAIGTTGVLLRHFVRSDITAVKELTLSLVRLQPALPAGIHPLVFTHLFLVCALFAYFPFSKLVHLGGVFLSPTRNLANNNRVLHHDNPWGKPGKAYPYEDYENEFRDRMKAAGIPVEKE
jgi:nitrate reductase gamma subunit